MSGLSETLDRRMFDFDGFYQGMIERMPNNPVIAEVGVATGASAIFMAEKLVEQGRTFKFSLIDNLAYGGQDQLQELVRNVTRSGLAEMIEIVPVDSLNASCRYPESHFDFVFIDASHRYEYTKADIRLWYRKVKVDGILAGHDYNEQEGKEVKQAVDELLPREVTRGAIATQDFPPKQFLHTEETAKGHGVWWVYRKFYINL